MGNFTAFLDASVLYPAPLRDLLMELAVSDLYRAKWSNAVHEEWINAVLQNRHDLTRAQLERTRDLMNANARDALVTDFEQLIDMLELPDQMIAIFSRLPSRAVRISLSRPISRTSLPRRSIDGELKPNIRTSF